MAAAEREPPSSEEDELREELEVSTWRIGVGATCIAVRVYAQYHAARGCDSETDESELVATWRLGVGAAPRAARAPLGAGAALAAATARREARQDAKLAARAHAKRKEPKAVARAPGAHGHARAVGACVHAAGKGSDDGDEPSDADGAEIDDDDEHEGALAAEPSRCVGVRRMPRRGRESVDGSKWCAQIWLNGRSEHLGTYATQAEAMRAYDAVAREHGHALNSAAAHAPPAEPTGASVADGAGGAPKLLGVKRLTRGKHLAQVYGANIFVHGRRFILGAYRSAHAAAMVHDAFARTHGMRCNFEPPPPVAASSLRQLVGRRVSVYWRKEGVYFDGTLTTFDRERRTFHVDYDDGDSDDGIEIDDPEVVLLPECVSELVAPAARS